MSEETCPISSTPLCDEATRLIPSTGLQSATAICSGNRLRIKAIAKHIDVTFFIEFLWNIPIPEKLTGKCRLSVLLT